MNPNHKTKDCPVIGCPTCIKEADDNLARYNSSLADKGLTFYCWVHHVNHLAKDGCCFCEIDMEVKDFEVKDFEFKGYKFSSNQVGEKWEIGMFPSLRNMNQQGLAAYLSAISLFLAELIKLNDAGEE